MYSKLTNSHNTIEDQRKEMKQRNSWNERTKNGGDLFSKLLALNLGSQVTVRLSSNFCLCLFVSLIK